MGADHSGRTPRVFGSVGRNAVDGRNSTGVTSHSSPLTLFSAQPSGLEGPGGLCPRVSGFADQRLSTRPPGQCQCGCGEPTPLAKKTDRRKGYKKGEPTKYLPGHQTRYNELPVDRTAAGCWIWQAATNSKGYPIRGNGAGEKWLVHRRQYEEAHGPIPAGRDIHHRCHNPLCVNPAHLEALTRSEHQRRHRDERLALARRDAA